MHDDKLIEAMRESFEAWFSDDWQHPSAVERDAVGYKLAQAQNAWTVWQAAWQDALAALQETHAVVPREPTPEMRSEFERWYSENGQHMDAVERLGDGYHLGSAQFAWMAWKEAWIAAAPAPVASAADVELVAEALWLAQTLRLLRDAPEQARLEYAELDDATKGHLRWDARAALRAMGYEVPARD